ncbi:MAG: HD domain-containing phosphohydrolase [Bdellovibrionota bacterium]
MTDSKNKTTPPGYLSLPIEKVHTNMQLPFSIYVHLPENNKMILFRAEGEVLQKVRLDQISKYSDKFFIKSEDRAKLEAFLNSPAQSVASKLSEVINLPSKSVAVNTKTELQLRSMEMLTKQLHFSIDPNSAESPVQQATKHIHKVVDDVLDIVGIDEGIVAKIQSLQNSLNNEEWNHSLSVAAVSALFAISLGYTDKKLLRDIATGGYLHDIGLVACDVPMPKRDINYTPEEMELYKNHPRAGLELIETLELPVSEEVKLIIYQHEEKYDGGGFPMDISGPEIFEPAQIIAIADRFDALIRVDEPGWLTPEKALYQLLEENSKSDLPCAYSPLLVVQIAEAAFAAGAID